MHCLETIQALSDKAARAAARVKKQPYVPWNAEEARSDRLRSIPFIGGFKPKGWKKVDELFVDSSGFGRDYEAALTFDGFRRAVVKNIEDGKSYGYAIIEAGQFQVYIGVFEVSGPEAHEGTKSEGRRPPKL